MSGKLDASGKLEASILWVDDDKFRMRTALEWFECLGYHCEFAVNASDAVRAVQSHPGGFDVALIDLMLPPGDLFQDEWETKGGFYTGVVLAKRLKEIAPEMSLVCLSHARDPEAQEWFGKFGDGYINKGGSESMVRVLEGHIDAILRKRGKIDRKPKVFIVHGQDDQTKLELKNYLQNVLELGEPIILHERPNMGRTIIEKFEEEAEDVDVVFILLTPDDKSDAEAPSNHATRRARQNVIFEAGFFYGLMQRRSGRVILCYKETLELPSDIKGVGYINISNGIESASEEIRREMRQWLREPS